jgi:TonB family protein
MRNIGLSAAALILLVSLLLPVRAAGTEEMSVKRLCREAMAASSHGDLNSAANLFEKARQQAKREDAKSLELALIEGNLGIVYRALGKHAESEAAFRESDQILSGVSEGFRISDDRGERPPAASARPAGSFAKGGGLISGPVVVFLPPADGGVGNGDLDFGPYAADLQRRIKRHWFPPKGNESKCVVVLFRIHKGGELSNLRLEYGCGTAIADKAALDAVQNAAPMRPLPDASPESVEIQFTFDYNVFTGTGSSEFRRF